ncbi:hypothetical protein PRIPAC_70392 [Pristionchus pacificus]|uniref:Uncharacterized protein n=1 Tax=Pristionchus pacificus TaxID=54126 RepID=A0A2A6CEQ3_PRIPA|nr:hypothetical protein PRIPAC_70392 [Pristionchus pacificus]|eukprot:PDM76682.1 hypothetical protein PRIPAC_42077 [Pristionchus pacificus]
MADEAAASDRLPSALRRDSTQPDIAPAAVTNCIPIAWKSNISIDERSGISTIINACEIWDLSPGVSRLDEDGEISNLMGNFVHEHPRKDAPMASPSVKLWAKSATRLRYAATCEERLLGRTEH